MFCESDDDRLRARFFDALRGFDAVKIGKADIHQDDVGFVLDRLRDRFFPVSCMSNDGDIGMLFKDVLHQLPGSLIIIHHKNAVLSHFFPSRGKR